MGKGTQKSHILLALYFRHLHLAVIYETTAGKNLLNGSSNSGTYNRKSTLEAYSFTSKQKAKFYYNFQ